MLYFILNHKSIFDTVRYLKGLGFNENSFVIGPLYDPIWLNVLCLSKHTLSRIKTKLQDQITKTDWYLKNSYENILNYITNTKWEHNMEIFYSNINELDKRRNTNWKNIFKNIANE